MIIENKLVDYNLYNTIIEYNDLKITISVVDIYENPVFQDQYPMHDHEFFEFILLQEGFQLLTVEDTEFFVNINDFVLVPPGIKHGHVHYSDMGIFIRFYIEKCSCSTNCSKISDEILQNLRLAPRCSLSDEKITKLLTCFPSDFSKEDASLRLLSWIQRLSFLCGLHRPDNINKKFNGSMDEKELIKQVATSISTLYMTNIGVDYLADYYNISYRHLSRLFVKHTGYTIVQFRTLFKLKNAQRLLTETTYCILQIANKCGFQTESYMSHVFKKYLQISPDQYRKTGVLPEEGQKIIDDYSTMYFNMFNDPNAF